MAEETKGRGALSSFELLIVGRRTTDFLSYFFLGQLQRCSSASNRRGNLQTYAVEPRLHGWISVVRPAVDPRHGSMFGGVAAKSPYPNRRGARLLLGDAS